MDAKIKFIYSKKQFSILLGLTFLTLLASLCFSSCMLLFVPITNEPKVHSKPPLFLFISSHCLPVVPCLCFLSQSLILSFTSPCPESMFIFSSTAAGSLSSHQFPGPFSNSLVPASQPFPNRPWFGFISVMLKSPFLGFNFAHTSAETV